MKSIKNKILHKTVSGVELRRLVLMEKPGAVHFYSSKYLSKNVPIEVARLFPSSSFNMAHKIHNKIKDEISKTTITST